MVDTSVLNTGHINEYLNKGIDILRREDPLIYNLLEREHERQANCLTLVASCGGTDPSVLAVTGSTIVNVTAEGYPGKRYHAGCQYVDEAENLAIERAKKAFNAQYVNVQPHCASFANHTVLLAVLKPGDKILGLRLDQGGHLTHGASVNISGKLFEVFSYGLDEAGIINYSQMRDLAHAERPRMIICGTTSYSRTIDFDRIRDIADEVGAYVLADITHIAGLIAAGEHQSSIDAAHFTTTCTFKQLYGPRGGLIMMGRDANTVMEDDSRTLAQRMQSAVFPMMQGSPEVHTIAAKARALGRILKPEYVQLAAKIKENANALAIELLEKGYNVIGGGTDNHIVLFEAPPGLNGVIVERVLESCGILVNKNKLPNDHKSAMVTSGVRLGSNTVSLRDMGPMQMKHAVELIDTVLRNTQPFKNGKYKLSDGVQSEVSQSVRELCQKFPLPYNGTA